MVSGSGQNRIRVDSFEIMDHPVTNAEYYRFVDATGFTAPLHWKNGLIPKGKEDYPVIYVNREDAEFYSRWLSQADGRVYRIPKTREYEFAARGNLGNDKSILHENNVNFDSLENRMYDQWEDYLKPARWGLKNEFGLYGMAENIWELTSSFPDYAIEDFKFRIDKQISTERTIMGGSWARGKEYLRLGSSLNQSPMIRLPDLGFRLVREPVNGNWETIPRKISAVMIGNGYVSLSWAVLERDQKNTSYDIYRIRGGKANSSGIKLNNSPVRSGSCFVDSSDLRQGEHYMYQVRPVNDGKQGNPSEWIGLNIRETEFPIIVTFSPIHQGTVANGKGLVPVFGDLEGNGRNGCVIRLANGCFEKSQDPGYPVQLEAFTSYGRSLWRKDAANHENIYGSASNCPFNVWDMDGDGKAEVITLLQIGEDNHIAILDGMTGKVKYKTPWPEMISDHARSSTRIQISIGYLDGKNPSVITQTGIYENEVISAFDSKLNPMWTYNSFDETNGSGGHKIEIADVDGNGLLEVIYGTTCLNSDGTLRWSIYKQHPDIISIQDYLPDRPGLEVFFLVESSIHAGVYLVDANSGEIIWKNNRTDDPRWSHGHYGWTADIWSGSPGMEILATRNGHYDSNIVLFSADGKNLREPFQFCRPVEWDGDHTRELLFNNGYGIGKFDGEKIIEMPGLHPNPVPNSTFLFAADLYGDFRSELVILLKTSEGKDAVSVLAAPLPVGKKYIAPSENLSYRLWIARNFGGGYASIFDQPLQELR